MKQEDKELLLKDLSGRLPHHVRCKVWLKDGTAEEGPLDLQHNYGDVLRDAFYYNKIKDIKPYLRPMSSMTDDEREEFNHLYYDIPVVRDCGNTYRDAKVLEWMHIDWYNKHHFDYRGLIEKGLALEAPEGMYRKEEQL